MAETTDILSVCEAHRIVEECVDFARGNVVGRLLMSQVERMDSRARLRLLFTYQLRYCTSSILSEDHSEPARMLDISLHGMALWCCEGLTPGTVIHVRLPLLDGTTAWVQGRVIYCNPDVEDYRVGIAFVFEQEESQTKAICEQP